MEHSLFLKEEKNIDDDKNILDFASKLAPVFQQLFPVDCCIAVSDKERFVSWLNGKELVFEDTVGTLVPPEDPMHIAIHSGQVNDIVVGKEVYGIANKSRAVPLRNSRGQIIGSVGVGLSLTNQETLLGVVDTIAAVSKEISAACENLATAADQLAQRQEELNQLGQNIFNKVKKTDSILNFINEVATSSNLLGFNASIEAARAGEKGLGFSVVADEISKLAVNSRKSVVEVKEILEQIKTEVNDMTEKISHTSFIAQDQAKATQEIVSSVHELTNSVSNIANIAEII